LNISQSIIHKIESKDFPDLLEFLLETDNQKRERNYWEKRLRHWWDDNPCFSKNMDRGWILRDKITNAIVGFHGNIPSIFKSPNDGFVINNASTWRVLDSHRHNGINLLFELIKNTKTILFSTTPNEGVNEINKKLKFKKFPYNTKKTHSLVVNNKIKIKSYNSTIFNFFSIITFSLLKFFQQLYFSKPNNSGHIKKIDKIENSFDVLWEEKRNDYLYTNVRSSEAINWYCFSNENEKIVFGYYLEDKLVTYIIYDKRTSGSGEQLFCVDLWGALEKDILESLIIYTYEYSKKNGINLIRFNAFDEKMCNFLDKIILIRNAYEDKRYLITRDKKININKNNSYLTYAQGDIGL